MLQVKFVNGVETKGATLPRLLLVILQVLQDARPAVDVSTLCDPRTDHI